MLEKIEKESKDIVCVYTTCSSKDEAMNLGRTLIKEKLAISLDYWFINSMYPWEGVIRETNQYMLMFSTQRILSEKLIKHIESIHSYTIPVITMCDTSMTNKQYGFWAESLLINKDEYLTEKEFKIKKNKEEYSYERLK